MHSITGTVLPDIEYEYVTASDICQAPLPYSRSMEIQAMVLVDRDGVIQGWNESAETLFGYANAEALGKTLDLIIPDQYRDRHWAAFPSALNRGRTTFEPMASQIPVRCQDGALRNFPARLTIVLDADNRAVGAVGVFSVEDKNSNLPILQ